MASAFDPNPELHPADRTEPRDRPLAALYEEDETAWLETMSRLVAERRCDELDYENLSEFLADTAKRDQREVFSRLKQLLLHLLKWDYEPARRSRSWRDSVVVQQDELKDLCESGTLLNHARAVLDQAYQGAVRLASKQTGLREDQFPGTCPWSLEVALDRELEPPTDAS
jgi:hypothetical protein